MNTHYTEPRFPEHVPQPKPMFPSAFPCECKMSLVEQPKSTRIWLPRQKEVYATKRLHSDSNQNPDRIPKKNQE